MLSDELRNPNYARLVGLSLGDPALVKVVLARFPTPQRLGAITVAEAAALEDYDPAAFRPFLAAVALGKLVLKAPHDLFGTAASSAAVGRVLVDELAGEQQESVIVLCTDVHNRVVAVKRLFVGGLAECSTYPSQVLRYAIKMGAYGFLLAHNHPSGRPQPSPADYRFFSRMARAGDLVGLNLVDALIIGRSDYYSWQEERRGRAVQEAVAES